MRVLHNLIPHAKNDYFCYQLGSKAAVYSIVNEHLRTTLGAKKGLFAKVSLYTRRLSIAHGLLD